MKFHSCCRNIFLLLACASAPAFAALGDSVEIIPGEQARLKASSRTMSRGNGYTIHEMQLRSETVVREYASDDGIVFAVTWKGPVKPELSVLLGRYFSKYRDLERDANISRRLRIQDPQLIVESEGHLRAFSGKAYLPELMPSGVTPNEIR